MAIALLSKIFIILYFKKSTSFKSKSLRLNIFKGIDYSSIDTSLWDIKDNIEWIKNCPLPKNEVFQKLTMIKKFV